ncbi:isoprenoid synthase domain-containing protein [Hysterangium stoloniferum]|nr:isoprenoid synthase domain-containing protein [Hysterangium stoloniferum]
MSDFFTVRRRTVRAEPCFPIAEFTFDLPDEVHCHPVTLELSRLACDMIILDNDMISYNKEQSEVEFPHNIITVLMHRDRDYSVQQAMDKAAEMHKGCSTRFVELWNELPSWGPTIDPIARKYVQGIVDVIMGNYYWSFEIDRYFGSAVEGKQALETGMVTCWPKYNPTTVQGLKDMAT